MVYAAIRQGPVGDSRLVRVDRAAADRIRGVSAVIENPRWVAAVANNWWAANRALDALAPRFETKGAIVDSASIDAALEAALDGKGERLAKAGDLPTAFRDAQIVPADYRVALGVNAGNETTTETAESSYHRPQLWEPPQPPGPVAAPT